MSIGDFFRVKSAFLADLFFSVKRYYWKSFRFALIDSLLLALGFFCNPYRLCRKRGGGIYGETPFRSLERMASFLEIQKGDVFYDLGSGRGRSCFWMSTFLPCKVVGVEKIPFFAKTASFFAKLFRCQKVSFSLADFVEMDLSEASYVYFFATAMEDEELEKVACHLTEVLSSGAKIIAISAPMKERGSIKYLGSFPMEFIWGQAEAYLHEISPLC